ncbi:hypothetical protein Efla_000710 [Eimeria flavescens]
MIFAPTGINRAWPRRNTRLTATLPMRNTLCKRAACKLSKAGPCTSIAANEGEAWLAPAAGAASSATCRTYQYTTFQHILQRAPLDFASLKGFVDPPALPTNGARVRPARKVHRHFGACGVHRLARESASSSACTSATGEATSSPRADSMAQQLERLWGLPAKPPHIPNTVWRGILRGLHLSADNPIGITAQLVEAFFRQEASRRFFSPFYPTMKRLCKQQRDALQQEEQASLRRHLQHQDEDLKSFVYLNYLNPLVSVRDNFDSLLISAAHSSRSTSDTYYIDPAFSLSHAELAALARTEQTGASSTGSPLHCASDSGVRASSDNEGGSRRVLRTHGTAHQAAVLGCGLRRAVWSGAVARRDQVDQTHYPVFHQIDGIRIFEPEPTNNSKFTDMLEALMQQHIALLQCVDRAAQLQQLPQQHLEQPEENQEKGEDMHGAFKEACVAAGMDDVSALAFGSFACLDSANPHRNNPVVLQLQLTLERLVRYLWTHKPSAIQPKDLKHRSTTQDTHTDDSKISKIDIHSGACQPKLRWAYDAYFPFTYPSVELEIFHEGAWIEVLGAGEIQARILTAARLDQQQRGEKHQELLKYLPVTLSPEPFTSGARGWAFGLGIERLAMLLFSIDDIRLLWSEDPRYTSQFTDGRVKTFVPFSHMPPVFKDVSFWLPADSQPANSGSRTVASRPAQQGTYGSEIVNYEDSPSPTCGPAFDVARFNEICREEGGALIESVILRDVFTHPLTGRKSMCFRLTYKALDRTLTHCEVNALQDKLVAKLKEAFGVELR